MLKELKLILEMQELDMKMLRLMRLKKERQKELHDINSLREELQHQLEKKRLEIKELNEILSREEFKIEEAKDKFKKLEAKQSTVKKVDEFNALNKEMNAIERERSASTQMASDIVDKRNSEEEILVKIQDSLTSSADNSRVIEEEIKASIEMINKEGSALKTERDVYAKEADTQALKIYEKLLYNKKDRVVVPIENRTCSGCHISLTAQHENLVRKGERMIFCEHCSRILYWPESEELEGTEMAPTRRRRRVKSS
jgi:uncharacterized protein